MQTPAQLYSILRWASTLCFVQRCGNNQFHIKRKKEARKWIEKYGLWSLLIVQWVPIIGDPVMIAMGSLKVDFRRFFIFLLAGEVLKLFVLIQFTSFFISLF